MKTNINQNNDVLRLIYPHNRLNIEVTPSRKHERSIDKNIPFVNLSCNAQDNLLDKDTVSGFLKISKFNIPKEKSKPKTANSVSRRMEPNKIEHKNASMRIISPEVFKIAQFYELPTKVGLVDYETTFGVSTPDDSFLAFGTNNDTFNNRNQRIGSEMNIFSYEDPPHKNILSRKLRVQSSKIRINARPY